MTTPTHPTPNKHINGITANIPAIDPSKIDRPLVGIKLQGETLRLCKQEAGVAEQELIMQPYSTSMPHL